MLVVEGKNGCGKTSLLRLLTGLSLPESGEIRWNDESIRSLGSDYYQCLNYIGHHDGLKRDLSCIENLRIAQALRSSTGMNLEKALQRVRLRGFEDNPVGTLSAGQKRRLALARLLVTDAPLWILDEPFTSLDKASMALFADIFTEHLQGQGMIVMTSHHDIVLPHVQQRFLNLSER